MDCLKIAAVVPVKGFEQSKSRLSVVLKKEERQQLVMRMLEHLLAVLIREKSISAVYVITPDQAVGEFVHARFARVQVIFSMADLNEAVNLSAQVLQEDGYMSMLFLFSDLPFLTSADLQAAVQAARESSVVLMPDGKKKGTNGIALTPPDCMCTCFGEDSFSIHMELAKKICQEPCVLETYGFAQDIDLPDDLELLEAGRDFYGRDTWTCPSP